MCWSFAFKFKAQINPEEPRACQRTDVCLFVSPSLSLGRFGQLLRYADKRIVNIMKVCIERNNLQVELIRRRKFIWALCTFTFAKQQIQCNIAH